MSDKFFGFFWLVDACNKPGCPVCRCLDADSRRHLGAILYEEVNDPGLRAVLRASRGFCNWHSAMLREIPDSGFGSALISADLLARACVDTRELAQRAQRRPIWRRMALLLGGRRAGDRLGGGPRKIICPVCERLRDGERRYLATVLRFTGDPQFDRAFDQADGLCVPHVVRLVTDNGRAPALARLVERNIAKWRQLGLALDAFVGKHEYRNQMPITEQEGRSWQLVLEMLAGAPGVFGNELLPSWVVELPNGVAPRARGPVNEEVSDVETLRFEREMLDLRVKQLTEQLGEASSRAAALHYRLWETLEDRRALEMNLTGERGASKMWEQTAIKLREENERLRRQVGGVPEPAAQSPTGAG